MLRQEEFFFDSRDNQDKIHAMKWIPEGAPICVLQIIHGMAEHISCYDHFARNMAERGILVVGEDHLGHGESLPADGVYGYFCREEAATVVVRDVHRLKKIVQEENVGVPYFILGHSMGSFILRNYFLRYGKGINGAIIVGTGSQSLAALKMGKALAAFLAIFQGWKHPSKFIHAIAFGSYNKRIKKGGQQFDWICTNPERIDSYKGDEGCGFVFTLNGFHTLFTLIEGVTGIEKLTAMPKDLPVLMTSGQEDPVGAYGSHVKKIYEEYLSIGIKDVTLKMYEGFRHEILNEVEKQKVYEDIYKWITDHLKENE